MTTAIYILATILFILSLGGLSNQESAKRSIWYGILAMALAIVATIIGFPTKLWIILPMLLIGGTIGIVFAKKVEMTEMPELVAAMHSLVGLVAVFLGINAHLENIPELSAAEALIRQWEISLGVFIGAVTFTGSIIAYGKLSGRVGSKPLTLPLRHLINLAIVIASLALMWYYQDHAVFWPLLLITLLAFVLGVHLVMAIGGADMPVVVSMLNSYSGWAAAATGFTLGNDLLIVVGALVGSSGAILSYIMSKAMNRSFVSVIMGGFGSAGEADTDLEGEQIAIEAEQVAEALEAATNIIIVPGYGMAVAQAQGAVSELTRKLRAKGKNVRFAIHPVAGRMPGHMNVLLAEAKVSYDIVLGLEEINEDFPKTDVVIVIGSNDIVNPAAIENEKSPIYGMPVLEVWRANTVFVMKRGQGTGYSGISNPLFVKENTRMFFGDAKESLLRLLNQLS